MVASGQYSAEYEKRLHDLSNSIQATTTTGDEAAMHMMANFISIGKVAPDSIDAITRATIGYADLTGKAVAECTGRGHSSLADIANESKTSLGEMEQLFTGAEQAMLRALKETEGGMAAQAAAIEMLNKQFALHATSVKGRPTSMHSSKTGSAISAKKSGGYLHRFVGPAAQAVLELVRQAGRVDGHRGGFVCSARQEVEGVHIGHDTIRLVELDAKIPKVFRLSMFAEGSWIVPRKIQGCG